MDEIANEQVTDMTDDQVVDMISQYYPGEEAEVLKAFQQLKEQLGLNNYETVVMVQQMLRKDKSGLDSKNSAKEILAQPRERKIPEVPGRLSKLKGTLGGK